MKIKQAPIKKALTCVASENAVNVAKILKKNKERHLFVLDKEKPIGIISTTDISNNIVAMNEDPKKKKANEIMNSRVIVKDIEDALGKAYYDMVKAGVLSCAVTSKSKFKGVLYLRDTFTLLAKERANKK